MSQIKQLNFQPILGLSSHHLQMIFAIYTPTGVAPPSVQWLVDIGNQDQLSCEVSTPSNWTPQQKTVALIHGMGGSHTSRYMIRMARKFYEKGYKVVRINLRGCGSGVGLSHLPYCAGNSHDILYVLKQLKADAPNSEIDIIGFSLGGNIALKLAGELGPRASTLINTVIAVCPPIDLKESMYLLMQRRHYFYHRYYLHYIFKQAIPWLKQKIHTLYELDEKITGPLWGYQGASDYYEDCSSKRILHQICCNSHLLFAEDDPFVSLEGLKTIELPAQVQLWATKHGSHLGFLGRAQKASSIHWIDHQLLHWVS